MTEETAAEPGHNSDRQALFMRHLHTIQTAEDKLDEFKAEVKKIRKLAKADGFKLADFDFAMKALTMEDDTIMADDLKRQIEILRWLDIPIGYQADIEDADRRPMDDKAFNQGEFAGMRHVGTDENPYDSDPLRSKWLEGWHVGRDRLKAVSVEEEEAGAEILKPVGQGADADEDPFEDDQTGDKGNVPEAEAAE